MTALAILAAAVASCGCCGRDGLRVSSLGYRADDATAIIQKALDSGAKTVVLDRQAGPWVAEPLFVRSGTELVFEEGVELVAKRGAFKGLHDALLNLESATNVVIRGLGRGATLRMWKKDYQDKSLYRHAEWRHTLRIMRSANVRVENLSFVSSGGDGIYLGSDKPGCPNRDIVIRDCICDDNHRQGISVITANGLTIERTVMKNTRGTDPQSGIDFEPNGDTQELRNIVLRDCVTENNVGAGYDMYFGQLTARTPPISITLERCKSLGDRRSPLPLTFDPSRRNRGLPAGGSLVVRDCEFRDSPRAAVMITDKPLGVMDAVFENCTFANCPSDAPDAPAVRLSSSLFRFPPTDGVTFRNVTICRGRGGDWFNGCSRPWADTDVRAIGGDVTVVENGTSRRIVLDEAWKAVHFPRLAKKSNMTRVAFDPATARVVDTAPGKAVALSEVRLRGEFATLFHAAKPGSVTFEVRAVKVNAKPLAGKPFVVTDMDGRTVAELAAPTCERAKRSFEAPAPGFYRMTCAQGPHCLVFFTADAPMGVMPGNENGLNVFKSAVTLWFAHRAEDDATLFLGGGSQEFVTERLTDPAGRIAAEWRNIDDWRCHPLGPQDGLWKLEIRPPDKGYPWEDSYLNRTGEPPVFFLSREKHWKTDRTRLR